MTHVHEPMGYDCNYTGICIHLKNLSMKNQGKNYTVIAPGCSHSRLQVAFQSVVAKFVLNVPKYINQIWMVASKPI